MKEKTAQRTHLKRNLVICARAVLGTLPMLGNSKTPIAMPTLFNGFLLLFIPCSYRAQAHGINHQ